MTPILPDNTGLDIANLTKEQAIQIYRAEYWNKLWCDQLPGGLDLLAFDAAANEGPARAAKMLQAVLKVTEDGVVGPSTIDAAQKGTNIVTDYLARRMYQYALIPEVTNFGRGWFHRLAQAAQVVFSHAEPEAHSVDVRDF